MALKWIGLTGSIGTGKSTVARLLRERGFQVVDADQLARQAVEKDSPGLTAVVQEFGKEIQTKAGELDRKKLAELVFQNKENLLKLEKIVHPIVRRLAGQTRRSLEEKGETLAFYDVPLLFEKNMESMFDAIVVVASSEQNQINRLKQKFGWNLAEIRQRLNNQMPLSDKIKKAEHVIHNDGSVDELNEQVDDVVTALKAAWAL